MGSRKTAAGRVFGSSAWLQFGSEKDQALLQGMCIQWGRLEAEQLIVQAMGDRGLFIFLRRIAVLGFATFWALCMYRLHFIYLFLF